MSDSDPVCNEPLSSKDGRCERRPKYPDGKCGFHTETKDNFGGDDWKPSYKHGLYMDRSGYYEELPESEQKWIDAVTDSFLKDAPFDEDSLGKLEKLRQVSIDLHKKRRADEYIAKKGMTQTQDVGFHEQYGLLEEEKENVLHITADRLSRESRMTLKDLNIIGNEEKKSGGEEARSLIEQLAEAANE